ncbi:MAG TPA: hypothetical protein VJ483_04715 [Holophagaceae bacterium]|nr:hypothetical protein [Holophagaceae bacterium]
MSRLKTGGWRLGPRHLAPAAIVLLLACGSPQGFVKQLPSGRSFRVLQAGQVRFGKTGETAAMLVYETSRKPEDSKGLEQEATELWDYFRPEVEKTPQHVAIVQANSPDRGFLLKGQALAGFQWEKQADGSWARKLDAK